MRIYTLGLVACLALGVSTHAQAPAKKSDRLALKAVATSTGGPLSNAVLTPVDIVFERWSDPEDEKRLLNALKEGQDEALKLLRKFKRVGFMSRPGHLGQEFFFVSSVPTVEGGRRVFAATDRPMGFSETVNQPKSYRYPFTLIELNLDANNEGTGKLYEAVQLVWLGKSGLLAENYTGKAIDLTKVKPR
jgi:hypothetical protein